MEKVAIVTGCASQNGIGYAIARALACDGVRVILTDINAQAVQSRAKELSDAGHAAFAIEHDITDERSWQDLFAHAEALLGLVSTLVNNAGVAILKPMERLGLADMRAVCDANLIGAMLGCRNALMHMRQHGRGGGIINISSVSALMGFHGNAAYGATKGGIQSLSRHVAIEGAPDAIRCNTVHPGAIWTDIQLQAHKERPEQFKDVARHIPLGRIGSPADIGNMVAFLASEKASYITGGDFVVDGGLTSLHGLGA